MKIIPLLLFLTAFLFTASAQIQTDTASLHSRQDTVQSMTQQDSMSLAPQRDSIIIVTPIPELGSIEPFGDTVRFITGSDITWNEYRSLYDILSRQHGLFVRDLASPGQQNQLIASGLTDRNIAIMVDGIPYNDYFTGGYNLWLVPVDAIERIEYVTGAGSIFYDGKSAGSAINIVTKNYNNNRAITNLRYSQGVAGYVHTDAFFTQNVLRDLNLTLGLSHYGFGSNKESNSYRGRFYNSNNDAWIFRTKLRYNINDWFGLSFFYLYNKTWTGLHGGVNFLNTPSIFNGLEAAIQNPDSYEKHSNSQYNFTAAYYPIPDSTILATLSLYSFNRLREFRDEENRSTRNGIYQAVNFSSLTNGIKFQLKAKLGFNNITYYTNYTEVKKQNEVTVGIKDEISLEHNSKVAPFITVISSNGNNNINFGATAHLSFSPSFILFGGLAKYTAKGFPFEQPSSIMEIGAKFILNEYLTAKISYERITSHLYYIDTTQSSSLTYFSVSGKDAYNTLAASVHFTLGEFHLEGTANFFEHPALVRDNVTLTLYPKATLDGSVYFHGLLAKGNLDLKVGIRGRYFSEQTGMAPYNEYGVWIPSSLLSYGPSGTVDFFAIGKIGSAYVHLIWENLTGTEYLLAPVYPMYERNIRFGLSWQFLD